MDKHREEKIKEIMSKKHKDQVITSSEPETQRFINSISGVKHSQPVEPRQTQPIVSKPVHTPQDGQTITVGEKPAAGNIPVSPIDPALKINPTAEKTITVGEKK